MKKLKNIKSLLSREEMRQIQGGCGGIYCQDQCSDNGGCNMGQSCLSRYCGGHPNWRYCG